MNITIKTSNLDLTPPLKKYVEDKLSMLEKHYEQVQLVRVELEMDRKHRTGLIYRAEATVDAPRHVFRAEARGADMYAAVDLLEPKLIMQIEKIKHKKDSRIKKARRNAKEGEI